ncbi:DNA starvation/stationary phase protection protein [Entomospira entomophila]|uniref:DNA starvation/stationary phase protection protein n=1 Tax=Entomospira entomophila TaxID=2719988 RepID=A0A968GC58_9SPIO|nr:DNA starvation/stationary phase protection protein [Entomospira entomophilus]NIZ40913.1 DNA starvation/stationary phase protection protein [Entomospira entomophilus]WDI35126.1 DNA starvation/stationary phase protection protein [Entomospira entomophilus]
MTKELHSSLNQQVANLLVIYTKLHHYHWYATGDMFLELHEKFENLYNATASYYDTVAERLLMIGGRPVSSLKGSLEIATIKEEHSIAPSKEMVHSVIHDFNILIESLSHIADQASKVNDDVTADLCVGISRDLQKEVWLLKSLLA